LEFENLALPTGNESPQILYDKFHKPSPISVVFKSLNQLKHKKAEIPIFILMQLFTAFLSDRESRAIIDEQISNGWKSVIPKGGMIEGEDLSLFHKGTFICQDDSVGAWYENELFQVRLESESTVMVGDFPDIDGINESCMTFG
jgi:hypothetical protein